MAKPDPWLPFRRTHPNARVRLFCFPYAGGSASLFRPWQEEAPPSIEVSAVQLPGREARFREPPFTDMARLVSAIADALAPHLAQPFALFGHSLGALVSFELARELRRRGAPSPVHLFPSGYSAPHIPDLDGTYFLPDALMIERTGRLGGMSEEVLKNPGLLAMAMPVLRGDSSVTQTYLYYLEPPLDVPITGFAGDSDYRALPPTVEAWRHHTSRAFAVHTFPGTHFFLQSMRAPILTAIGDALA